MNFDDHQTRFTTRLHISTEDYWDYKIKYPKKVYNIQKRLIKFLEIDKEQIVPSPYFDDGIVTTITFPPGSCKEHQIQFILIILNAHYQFYNSKFRKRWNNLH